jgi:hypothetical protein
MSDGGLHVKVVVRVRPPLPHEAELAPMRVLGSKVVDPTCLSRHATHATPHPTCLSIWGADQHARTHELQELHWVDPQTNTVTVRDYDEVLDATADGPRRGDQARTYHTVSTNLLQDYLKVRPRHTGAGLPPRRRTPASICVWDQSARVHSHYRGGRGQAGLVNPRPWIRQRYGWIAHDR